MQIKKKSPVWESLYNDEIYSLSELNYGPINDPII